MLLQSKTQLTFMSNHMGVCKKPPVVDRSGFSLNMITAPIHVLFQQQLGKEKILQEEYLDKTKQCLPWVFTQYAASINPAPKNMYCKKKRKKARKERQYRRVHTCNGIGVFLTAKGAGKLYAHSLVENVMA